MLSRLAVRAATITALTFALLALGASAAQAAPAGPGPGNSPSAKQCHKGGWQNLVDANGVSFVSEQACVSYAAKGGVLSPKPTASLLLTVAGCSASTDPYYLNCGSSSLIGSGLQPGANISRCLDGDCVGLSNAVQQDGTISLYQAPVICEVGVVYDFRTTTASGTTIVSNSFECILTE